MKDGGPAIVVSPEDEQLLREFRWNIGNNGYAYKGGGRVKGRPCLLHRIVMNAEIGQEIHHINGIKTDCRRENLIVTTRQGHQDHHKSTLIERNRSKRIYQESKTCENCGDVFVVDRDHRGRNRFCSKRCGAIASAPERMAKRRINYGY